MRIDDTELPDLPGTICYEDMRKTSAVELAHFLKEKLEDDGQHIDGARSVHPVLQGQGSGMGDVYTARDTAIQILDRLAHDDFHAIAPSIHPGKGIVISLYAYIGQHVLRYDRRQFAEALSSGSKVLFGYADGSGFEIQLTLSEFLTNWMRPEAVWNAPSLVISIERISSQRGNTINNLSEHFPHAVVIEAYMPGTKQYEGFDWRAIRMALEQHAAVWYLVALVPDMWTI